MEGSTAHYVLFPHHFLAIAQAAPECKKVPVYRPSSRLSLLIPLPLLLAAGCTAQVYHPTKTPAEMQADVNLCTRQANTDYWFDPIAALYRSYDCLEAKGYKRSHKDFAAQVEQAFGEARREQEVAAQPCRVPCVPAKPPHR